MVISQGVFPCQSLLLLKARLEPTQVGPYTKCRLLGLWQTLYSYNPKEWFTTIEKSFRIQTPVVLKMLISQRVFPCQSLLLLKARLEPTQVGPYTTCRLLGLWQTIDSYNPKELFTTLEKSFRIQAPGESKMVISQRVFTCQSLPVLKARLESTRVGPYTKCRLLGLWQTLYSYNPKELFTTLEKSFRIPATVELKMVVVSDE